MQEHRCCLPVREHLPAIPPARQKVLCIHITAQDAEVRREKGLKTGPTSLWTRKACRALVEGGQIVLSRRSFAVWRVEGHQTVPMFLLHRILNVPRRSIWRLRRVGGRDLRFVERPEHPLVAVASVPLLELIAVHDNVFGGATVPVPCATDR